MAAAAPLPSQPPYCFVSPLSDPRFLPPWFRYICFSLFFLLKDYSVLFSALTPNQSRHHYAPPLFFDSPCQFPGPSSFARLLMHDFLSFYAVLTCSLRLFSTEPATLFVITHYPFPLVSTRLYIVSALVAAPVAIRALRSQRAEPNPPDTCRFRVPLVPDPLRSALRFTFDSAFLRLELAQERPPHRLFRRPARASSAPCPWNAFRCLRSPTCSFVPYRAATPSLSSLLFESIAFFYPAECLFDFTARSILCGHIFSTQHHPLGTYFLSH